MLADQDFNPSAIRLCHRFTISEEVKLKYIDPSHKVTFSILDKLILRIQDVVWPYVL